MKQIKKDEFMEKVMYRVPDLKGEIWAVIEEAPLYMVSTLGRVKSIAYERFFKDKNGKCKVVFYPERLIKQKLNSRGYWAVDIRLANGEWKRKTVHRLMGFAFLPPNPNPELYTDVCHINENNKDNRIENLKWGIHKDNCNTPLHKKRLSESHKNSMLGNIYGAKKVVFAGVVFESAKAAAPQFNVSARVLRGWLTGEMKMPEKYKAMGLAYIS